MIEASEVLYFGCWNRPGHFLYNVLGQSQHRHPLLGLIDSRLLTMAGAEDTVEKQGWVYVTRIGASWTVLSFWDRSGDGRGNSNSNFVFPGPVSYDDAMALARQAFPKVFDRFKFPIVQAHFDFFDFPDDNNGGPS